MPLHDITCCISAMASFLPHGFLLTILEPIRLWRPLYHRLLPQAPSSAGNGIDAALKFQELHNRLRLLNFVKKRGPMLHLLNTFMGTGNLETRPSTGTAHLLPQLFTEPAAALSGSERVTRPRSTPAVLPSEAHHYGESNGITREQRRAHAVGRAGGSTRARAVNEVTERALLRGILYAFQVSDPASLDNLESQPTRPTVLADTSDGTVGTKAL